MSKLSPTEFLERLKSGGQQQPGPAEEGGLPELNSLDFSDLETAEPLAAEDTNRSEDEIEKNSLTERETSSENNSGSDQETEGETDSAATVPPAIRNDSYLAELFDRVNTLLGDEGEEQPAFLPKTPESLEESGLTEDDLERLILKYLLSKGMASGRQVCQQIRIPFAIVDPLLKRWKYDQILDLRDSAEMGDYFYSITELGRERAKRYSEECSYYGAAPVLLKDYLKAMEVQSIAKQVVHEEDLKRAFSDLLIAPEMLDKLGPAINSGRGMFLFGEAGNGKTSIAERMTSCFGSTIWIPRALIIDADIMRLFDPGVHDEVEADREDGIFDLTGVDPRWVQITRPTVVAGGELTMSELEVTQNLQTKTCESPLQLKSNCGTLVIDDFGRQTMPVDELLNRWIVPLEKRFDYLNMPSGKKVQVPFDQLIVFSTNLEPKDLVDGAFLRRIPYKIEVMDPSREHFVKLFEIMAPKTGMRFDAEAVEYLIETHYEKVNRPFRACQPRDLLLQVRNFCVYKQIEKQMTPDAFDFAVANYFSIM